ncbi:hypothetical protein D9756_000806 [Leucocoprinus leucothites]|uniref:Uncharacterized protein n=1 Tax=Leucocoprinus leucothites TaxID=201217 RepID=A0A8H5GF81_9AGAR|nr:hypothetical protein D9756_000806 [Leucoagaricus leucothites]
MDPLNRPSGSSFNSITLPYTTRIGTSPPGTSVTAVAGAEGGQVPKCVLLVVDESLRATGAACPVTNGNSSVTEAIHAVNGTARGSQFRHLLSSVLDSIDRRATEQCMYRPTIPPSLRHLAHSQSPSESEQGENDAPDSGLVSGAEQRTRPVPPQFLTQTKPAIPAPLPDNQQYSEVVDVLSAIGQLLTHKGVDEEGGSDLGIRGITKFFKQVNSYFPDPELSSWLSEYFFSDTPVPSLWPILHRASLQTTSAQLDNEFSLATNYAVLIATVNLLSLQSLPFSSNDTIIFRNYEGDRDDLQARLYEFIAPLLMSFELLSRPKLEDVQASLLLSIYHLNEGNHAAAFWLSGISIRSAQLGFQKIVAQQYRALAVLSPSFLRWGEFSVISFDAVFALALLDSVNATQADEHLTEIFSWVTLSQSLLEKAPAHNIHARKGLSALDVLRSALLTAATPTSNLHRTPHFGLNPEMVTLAEEQPSPPALLEGLSTGDLPGGVLPNLISQPEVDLLRSDALADRVQDFLHSCIAVS